MSSAVSYPLNTRQLEGLDTALMHGGGSHSLAHVFAAVGRGDAQLWVEADACIVTEVNDAPNHRELHFWLATGTLDDLITLSNKVMDWGRSMGCEVATLTGRRGWTKALVSEGWEPHVVTMGRRL